MYIAPSSGHILFDLNMPLEMDSKEVWGCFLMSGMRMLWFLKDIWKFIQIHQYYNTMALRVRFVDGINGTKTYDVLQGLKYLIKIINEILKQNYEFSKCH